MAFLPLLLAAPGWAEPEPSVRAGVQGGGTASGGKGELATEANVRDLAAILYAEARFAGRPAMVAVGATVLNRMKQGGGKSVRAVWDAYSHPALPGKGLAPFQERERDTALLVARGLLDGSILDPTGGATHWFPAQAMPKDGEVVRGLDTAGRMPAADPDAAPPRGVDPCPVLPPVSLPLVWPTLGRFVGQSAHLDARACTADECRAAAALACAMETWFRREHVTRGMFTSQGAFEEYRRKLGAWLAGLGPRQRGRLPVLCRMAGRVAASVDGRDAHDGETRNALVGLAVQLGRVLPSCRTEILGAFPSTAAVQGALRRDWGECLATPARCPAAWSGPGG